MPRSNFWPMFCKSSSAFSTCYRPIVSYSFIQSFIFFIGFIATSPAAQLSPTELTEMRNELFNTEKSRQLSLTPRTEKIEVKHVGKTDPGVVFLMNKNISTPYSCAMRK